MTEDQAASERAPTLAEKINRLFETVHPPERGPYSNAEVEGALAQRKGGPTISATYLYQLRTGRKNNPTKRNLEALVSFFGVDPAYFFDDDIGRATFADLELLAALRSSADVRQLALATEGPRLVVPGDIAGGRYVTGVERVFLQKPPL